MLVERPRSPGRGRCVTTVVEHLDGAFGVARPRVTAPRAIASPTSEVADHEAEFTAFMHDAAPALGRLALFLTGDVHRADELVQQTLVRTYEAWPRARDGDPLVYARRILANQRIDTWRRRRREVLLDPTQVPAGAVTDGARERAERDQLVRALATLSPRRRRVVVLRYLLGLSEREVAAELGIAVGTVKSSASRGLAQLRQELGENGDGTDGRPR